MNAHDQPLVLRYGACTGCGNEDVHAHDCPYNWHNAPKVRKPAPDYNPKVDYPERYTDRNVI